MNPTENIIKPKKNCDLDELVTMSRDPHIMLTHTKNETTEKTLVPSLKGTYLKRLNGNCTE